MNLFNENIDNWDDWGKVFHSIPAFTPLVEYILNKENLPIAKIENLKPGTNAVFKAGGYVMKIFSPLGLSFDKDYGTNIDVELFGMRLANSQGVPAPRLIANGVVEDRYCFRYIIMEYIDGKMLDEIKDGLSYEDKVIIGQNVRKITDKLNVPCENFTNIDFMQYAKDNRSVMDWAEEGFPESLQKERLAYFENLIIDENRKVYCHGDFHCGNILVDDKLNVHIVDFADAMYAPAEYELVYIVSSLFCFEKPYMTGYFGEYDVDDIADLCMAWLPVHAWGHDATEGNLRDVTDIKSFAVMREKLHELIISEKNK